jgi:hypothetical protein
VVVDVKPRLLLAQPDVACTFAWTRRLVETRLFDAALLDRVRAAADRKAGPSVSWARVLDDCYPPRYVGIRQLGIVGWNEPRRGRRL